MSAVGLSDIPDTRKQQISDVVKNIKNTITKTLSSFKAGSRTIDTTQSGYQIPFFVTNYAGNSAITPTSAGNSFQQSLPPETKSMWVGVSYTFKVMQAQGMLLNDLNAPNSLVSEATLKRMAIEEYMLQRNYDAIGDGYGTRAIVTSVAGGLFTGTTAATTSPGYTKGAHRLQKNVTYDVVDESTLAVVGTITPTASGTGSATVTVNSTGSPNNAGAYVVEQGHFNKVPNGLGGLINNSDRYFQGLNTADHVEFNNSLIDLNGAALTSASISTLDTKVRIRTGDAKLGKIGHITPGLYNTLRLQGYSARSYWAQDGKADTTYGSPTKYEDRMISWVIDPDMDEDRVYLRTAEDYAIFEAMPFSPVKDTENWRINPGANDVGAWEYFKAVGWVYNLGFDGHTSGGNDTSGYIIRAAAVDTQVNAY